MIMLFNPRKHSGEPKPFENLVHMTGEIQSILGIVLITGSGQNMKTFVTGSKAFPQATDIASSRLKTSQRHNDL